MIELENEKVVLEENNLWIDWINDYQSNIEHLKKLSSKDKIEEMKRYVKQIEIFFNSETRKHRLDLKLR